MVGGILIEEGKLGRVILSLKNAVRDGGPQDLIKILIIHIEQTTTSSCLFNVVEVLGLLF
jgi:hypothetical protein